MVLGTWGQMEPAMRIHKNEPERETTIVPRTQPQPQRAPAKVPANDPAPQVQPQRERKKAA